MKTLTITLLLFIVSVPLSVCAGPPYLSHQDIAGRPQVPSDARIAYGPDSLQFGELRLPKGQGPHPVAVVLHGGCWLSIADLHVMDSFTAALAEAGIATWNIEYRPVDHPSGGWPGTFTDVGLGVDHVRALAHEYSLDLNRVMIAGHSAGGHLALWAAGRHLLRESSGESIGFIVVPDAAHFELIAPWTYSWPLIEASVQSHLAAPSE